MRWHTRKIITLRFILSNLYVFKRTSISTHENALLYNNEDDHVSNNYSPISIKGASVFFFFFRSDFCFTRSYHITMQTLWCVVAYAVLLMGQI